MNEHVRYEYDMMRGCHELLCAGIANPILKNAVHEAFYVHVWNLLTWYPGGVFEPESDEYRHQINKQILTLTSRRTQPDHPSRLMTPDVAAFELVNKIMNEGLEGFGWKN